MTPAELKEKGKKSVLKNGEGFAKALVNDLYDDSVDVAKEELKKLLPDVGDAILEMVVGALKAPGKAALLAAIDGISDEV